MNENEATETLKKICPTCGKLVIGGRRPGSFTAFLFGASDCTCSKEGNAAKAAQISPASEASGEGDFCSKCGLRIVTDSKDGSLTGFLFQSTRCKCLPDKAFADGEMSAKFWKLKQAGSGTVFTTAPSEASRAYAGSIDLAPGAIIGGAYRIVELIGRGGMGEVYLARHETLGKKCALKVIPPDQVTEVGWQRFQLEAKAVAKLEHINLVRVTDLGIHEGCLPFYAMDYVEGKNLAEYLAEQGPMPLSTMLEIFVQVCDGVECAHHAGILHRDLKPANIMLVTTKTGLRQAKVLDFGLAKLTKHDRNKQSLTAVGDVFGSPFYMSPEQCSGGKLDNRSDIYSLGCTIFECLTGSPPFTGHLASAVIFSHLEADPPLLESVVGPRRFPASAEVVIAKLLRKNPVERYQTLSQAKADLELIASGSDVQPLYVSGAKRSVPAKSDHDTAVAPSTNSPNVSVLFGSAIVLMLIVGSSFFVFNSAPKPAKIATQKPDLDGELTSLFQAKGLKRVGCTDKEIDFLEHYDFQQLHHDQGLVENEFGSYLAKSLRNGNHFLNKDRTIINFPPGIVIGAIGFGDSKPVLATGSIPVPVGEELCFYQNTCLLKTPSFLDMFGPADLTGLELTLLQPDKAIEKIKTWKRLTKLSFFNSLIKPMPDWEAYDQSVLTDRDLPALEGFRKLETLGLCGKDISGAKVAEMGLIRRLTSLRLKQITDIDTLLKTLPGLDNLKEVWLIGQDTTDEQLEYLTKMKNLESLRIRRSALTPKSLASFCRMQSLKHLYLDRDWSAGEKEQFKTALPFLVFESVIDDTYWHVVTSKPAEPIKVAGALRPSSGQVQQTGARLGEEDTPSEMKQLDTLVLPTLYEKWDGEPFYKGVVVHDGQKCRFWSFKGKRPPFEFEYVDDSGETKVSLLKGDVYIPLSAHVCLRPCSFLLGRQDLLLGLTDGNFDEVDFGSLNSSEFAWLAPAFAQFESVKAIRVGSSGWSVADGNASTALINQFKHLDRLLLFSKFDGAAISKIHCLNALQDLRFLVGEPLLQSCLGAIKGASNLRCLFIANVSGSPKDLQMIACCSHVEKLMIGNLIGSHEQISALSGMSALRHLDMPLLQPRPDLAGDLSRFKYLKSIKFIGRGAWSEAQIADLRQALPRVRVVLANNLQKRKDSLMRP